MAVAEKKTGHPYISIDRKLSEGIPVLKGTRIKVLDIATRYELMGMSPDDIVNDYPQLKLEQIHDALSYYYENKNIFDNKYREEQAFLQQLKKSYPSKLKAKIG